MTERGYTRRLHETIDSIRGCICPEEFEHDGKCQNALRDKKQMKCQPCSQGWHYPYPCSGFVSKGYLNLSTQCERCGWDSGDHPLTEERRALLIDSRTRRAVNT